MKKFLYFICFFILNISCKPPINNNSMYVSGDVSGVRNGSLILKKYQDSVLVTIDSFQIKGSSKFNLKAEINEPEIFHLYLKKNDEDSLNERIVFFGEKDV